MLDLRSSNPVLARTESEGLPRVAANELATIGGIANKTAMAISIALVGGLMGGALTMRFPQAMWVLFIASLVVTLVCYFAIYSKPERAAWGTPLYSLAQGATMGAFAVVLQSILQSMQVASAVHIGVQAMVITMAIAVAMLCVYRLGLIRANRTFVAVLSVLTLGVMLAYLANFILGFFGVDIPFLGLSSAIEGGQGAWIGVGINAFILLLASLWLVVDFQRIEEATQAGAPRSMEWYFTFALMVTLVWIYIEALKLAFRVAAANNRR